MLERMLVAGWLLQTARRHGEAAFQPTTEGFKRIVVLREIFSELGDDISSREIASLYRIAMKTNFGRGG